MRHTIVMENKEHFFSEALSNGITVVGEHMPYCRSVALGVWVRAGSIYEDDTNRGISHFIEHMLFKGTKNRSARDIAVEMDIIGGNLNAFTSKECTCYYTKVLDEHVKIAADCIHDMLTQPLLANEDIAREAEVVAEEILMNEDSPEDVAHEKLERIYYGTAALSYPILGTESSVKAITREDIQNYMRKRYAPSNIVISCAGNIDKEKILEAVADTFASDSSAGVTPSQFDCGGHISGREFAFVDKDVEQTHVCMGLPAYSIDDPLHYPLAVVNNVLGGSMSSRLFQKIREQRGLAYSVYSYISAYRDTGYLSLYAGAADSKTVEVCKLMLDEIDEIKAIGITDDELDRAKEQLISSFLLSQESTGTRSSAIGKAMLLRGSVRSQDEVLSMLKDISSEQCREAANYAFDRQRMACAVVGRAKSKVAAKVQELIMK